MSRTHAALQRTRAGGRGHSAAGQPQLPRHPDTHQPLQLGQVRAVADPVHSTRVCVCVCLLLMHVSPQGSGAGGEVQNSRGHSARSQTEVPAGLWKAGNQQEIPAVL